MNSIIKTKIDSLTDCHQHQYTVTNGIDGFYFYQSGNRDLNMIFKSKNDNDVFEIRKEDNYLLYKVFKNAYDSIKNLNFLENRSKEYIEVFKKTIYPVLMNSENSILWQSDAPVSDNSYHTEDLEYNFLEITLKEDSIILKFIYNKDKNKRCHIEFNTDRSRYSNVVYVFMDLLRNLDDITKPYRQITMDEYIESSKIKIK